MRTIEREVADAQKKEAAEAERREAMRRDAQEALVQLERQKRREKEAEEKILAAAKQLREQRRSSKAATPVGGGAAAATATFTGAAASTPSSAAVSLKRKLPSGDGKGSRKVELTPQHRRELAAVVERSGKAGVEKMVAEFIVMRPYPKKSVRSPRTARRPALVPHLMAAGRAQVARAIQEIGEKVGPSVGAQVWRVRDEHRGLLAVRMPRSNVAGARSRAPSRQDAPPMPEVKRQRTSSVGAAAGSMPAPAVPAPPARASSAGAARPAASVPPATATPAASNGASPATTSTAKGSSAPAASAAAVVTAPKPRPAPKPDQFKRKPVPASALPDLARIVAAGGSKGISKLVSEFEALFPGVSMRHTEREIHRIAERSKAVRSARS